MRPEAEGGGLWGARVGIELGVEEAPGRSNGRESLREQAASRGGGDRGRGGGVGLGAFANVCTAEAGRRDDKGGEARFVVRRDWPLV